MGDFTKELLLQHNSSVSTKASTELPVFKVAMHHLLEEFLWPKWLQ